MDEPFIFCLLAGTGSAAICWLVLRQLLVKPHRILVIDLPNRRSLHSKPTPKGGGIVMIGVAILIWALLAMLFSIVDGFSVTLISGVIVVAGLGWLDDHRGLSVQTKLLVEFGVGAIVLLMISVPVEVRFTGLVFRELPVYLVIPLVLLWIVWMVNLYNFMDGIDGLVTSQTIFASIVVAWWFYLQGDLVVTVFCCSLSGAGIGFLLFNWSPARVFLGDTGSLSLGLIFALLAVRGIQQHDIPASAFLLLHGVFLFDTTVTLCRRLFSGQRWWEAHARHLYQRAVGCGLGHAQVTILAMLWSVCLAILGTLEVLGISPQFLWLPVGLCLLVIAIVRVRVLEKTLIPR